MSKKFECKYCGKDFTENKSPQGALNLHEYRCKAKEENREKVKKNKNIKNETKCKICNTDLSILSPSVESHKQAINDNYDFYCPNCKELY